MSVHLSINTANMDGDVLFVDGMTAAVVTVIVSKAKTPLDVRPNGVPNTAPIQSADGRTPRKRHTNTKGSLD